MHRLQPVACVLWWPACGLWWPVVRPGELVQPVICCCGVAAAALLLCPGMVALSLGAVHAPKIDFEADSRGLLSLGDGRVAGSIKNLSKARFQDVSAHFANTAKKTPG